MLYNGGHLWGEVGWSGSTTLICASLDRPRGDTGSMFLGEFVHTLDSKGRLTVPARYRAELEAGMVVTRGIDRCLAVFPMAKWKAISGRVSELPMMNRKARALERFLFASAADVSPDKQGRILIPPRLRKYADLDGEVVVAGLNDHIELWNPSAWKAECDRADGHEFDLDSWAALGI